MSEYKNGSLVGGGGGGFTSKTITEDGSNVVSTDATGADAFFLTLAGSTAGGVDIGTGGVITIPAAGLEPTEGSFLVKVKPSAASTKQIIKKSHSGSDTIGLFFYGGSTLKYNVLALSTGGYVSFTPSNTFAVGQEVEVLITYTASSGVAEVYFDGVSAGTKAGTGTGNLDYTTASDYQLGLLADCTISSFAIFDSIVSASDAADLASGAKVPTDITGLQKWWGFTEGSGTTVGSVPLPSIDGTIGGSGATWVVSSQPFTLQNPTGLDAGKTYYYLVNQGGSRLCTFGSMFKKEATAAALQFTQTAGKKDLLVATCSSDGTELQCRLFKDLS